MLIYIFKLWQIERKKRKEKKNNNNSDILALRENQRSLPLLSNGWLTIADFDTFQLPTIKYRTSILNYDNYK